MTISTVSAPLGPRLALLNTQNSLKQLIPNLQGPCGGIENGLVFHHVDGFFFERDSGDGLPVGLQLLHDGVLVLKHLLLMPGLNPDKANHGIQGIVDGLRATHFTVSDQSFVLNIGDGKGNAVVSGSSGIEAA